MRKLVLVGMFLGCLWAAPSAMACGPDADEDDAVQIIIVPPSPVATQQSQSFLAEAMRLDGKASTEDSAASSALSCARMNRRRARAIRMQARQLMGASRSALFAKADRLDAQAMVHEADAAIYSSRSKAIRKRAKELRALSTQVLASGAVTGQVLARVMLLAPPAGHPDAMALRVLDAVPKVKKPMMHKRHPVPVRTVKVAARF